MASAIPPSFHSRHSSVSVRSHSSSRSVSVVSSASSSAQSPLPSDSDGQSQSNSGRRIIVIEPVARDNLLQFLQIDRHLAELGSGLRENFAKYKEISRVTRTVETLRANRNWRQHLEKAGIPFWTPTIVSFISIFIGKSQYYNKWRPLYVRAVKSHPTLVAWLNEDDDCLPDEELWGEVKETYVLADMQAWLDKRKHLEKKKVEGEDELENESEDK